VALAASRKEALLLILKAMANASRVSGGGLAYRYSCTRLAVVTLAYGKLLHGVLGLFLPVFELRQGEAREVALESASLGRRQSRSGNPYSINEHSLARGAPL
jgi:hypothetical protein